jgi:integrase
MNQLTTLDHGQPDLLQMIDRADLADSTKAQYSKALLNYLASGGNLADPGQLADYAHGLNKSSRSFLKAVVRLWTKAMGSQAKASANPENVAAVTATLYRLDALNEAIKTSSPIGEKAHTWLTPAEVKRLAATCDDSPMGRRDHVVLALLAGAGLRRAEAAGLTFDAIILQPGRGGKLRTVLQVRGKGDKNRIVPISDPIANLIDKWHKTSGGQGRICRSIGKGGNLGAALSGVGIFQIVAYRGGLIGRPELAPHDLRRTYAQIAYDRGVSIVQISLLLGHANVATTQRYLNLALDLETTASDFVPIV